jgi:hypothetical protein
LKISATLPEKPKPDTLTYSTKEGLRTSMGFAERLSDKSVLYQVQFTSAINVAVGVEPHALDRIIQEMVQRGRLEHPVPRDEVLRDQAVQDAYREGQQPGKP